MARREMLEINEAHGAVSGDSGEALYRLGVMHSNGRSVAPDFVAAHKWFNLAALKGHDEALRYRAEIAREMSNDEISAAQRDARAWMMVH